jgi:hypothetical protein
MNRLSDWRVRAFYVGCVLLVPFFQFVAAHGYGFLHPEVWAAAAVLAVESVLVALAARGAWFHLAMGVGCGAVAAWPVLNLARALPLGAAWAVAAALAVVFWALAARMREKFYVILAVFAWSGVAVEAAMRLPHHAPTVQARAGRPAGHVLWLLFDEHIGLNGFPPEPPACAAAKTRLTAVLERFNFTLFPNAYSNYPMTFDSVPSILQGRLVRRPGEWMERTGAGGARNYAMRDNPAVEEFRGRGYRAVVWQHAAVRICGEPAAGVECRDYEETMPWLHRAPGSWPERLQMLVGSYQASNPMRMRLKGFFPFRFGARVAGPPSLEGIWPDQIAGRIAASSEPTFFLAHLLTPHTPYVYRRDGALRPLVEWIKDRTGGRLPAAEYAARYARYCEQAEYTAGQLEDLLARLESGGLLNPMTVVVHGDHGSRIRRLLSADGQPDGAEAAGDSSPEAYDYPREPDARDLADRFSALLAIKSPGARRPETEGGRHSVLTFLSRRLFGREPADGAWRADQAYLKTVAGHYRPVDIQDYWR